MNVVFAVTVLCFPVASEDWNEPLRPPACSARKEAFPSPILSKQSTSLWPLGSVRLQLCVRIVPYTTALPSLYFFRALSYVIDISCFSVRTSM